MNNIIETIMYRGHEINMVYDECPISPDEWDNEYAFLVSYNQREFYSVPNDYKDKHDELCRFSNGIYEGYRVFPVAIFSHSGIRLKLGQVGGWDWSNGWAFVLVNNADERLALLAAQAVINEWNEYLSGDVYGYEIDESDSCYGFYGSQGYSCAIDEAKAIIDTRIEWDKKKFLERKKVEIKHRIPLAKRTTWKFNY